MTLLELAVVLALLGATAAVVLPALAPAPRGEPRLDEVVRSARSAAIARAQTLVLTVEGEGRFSVRALPPDDTVELLSGAVRGAPELQLQLTPLGACLPAVAAPGAVRDWDAAACRPRGPAAGALPPGTRP